MDILHKEKMTGKIKFKSEKEQFKELKNLKKTRDVLKYGQDGMIVVGEGKFTYKNISYLIKILRYSLIPFQLHAVVEYTPETKLIADFVKDAKGVSEFLYHDTLHSWNDNQTLEEQIKECHSYAKNDIDSLKDLPKLINKKILTLEKLREKTNNL